MFSTIENLAARGGIWLAGFKLAAQSSSWIFTIIIARILVPEDYGLFELATIITGYVLTFRELGLGAALIQREKITEKEISSLFYFTLLWGVFLVFVCFIIAYPTAIFFDDKRIIALTRTISICFFLGSICIVPQAILKRNLKFKTIGQIEAFSTIISSILMVIIAKNGAGVWTLVFGMIVRESLRAVILVSIIHSSIKAYFRIDEIRSFLKFGFNLTAANSIHYIYTKSDSFFAGRLLGSLSLGYYSMALQLSYIPSTRIVSLISSISFPVLSKYQKNLAEFKLFYLRLIKLIGFITIPMYTGGFLVADELIFSVLGNKWIEITFLFKILCLSQIVFSLTIPTQNVNFAQGRPHWGLYMSLFNLPFYIIAFYTVANYGLNAMVIPWVTIIPALRLCYMWITNKKIGVSWIEIGKSLLHPVTGTICMVASVLLVKTIFLNAIGNSLKYEIWLLLCLCITGLVSYSIYYITFNREFLLSLYALVKNKKAAN